MCLGWGGERCPSIFVVGFIAWLLVGYLVTDFSGVELARAWVAIRDVECNMEKWTAGFTKLVNRVTSKFGWAQSSMGRACSLIVFLPGVHGKHHWVGGGL